MASESSKTVLSWNSSCRAESLTLCRQYGPVVRSLVAGKYFRRLGHLVSCPHVFQGLDGLLGFFIGDSPATWLYQSRCCVFGQAAETSPRMMELKPPRTMAVPMYT